MAGYLWIIGHALLLPSVIGPRSRFVFSASSFFVLAFVYYNKGYSYDLHWYLEYFEDPWRLEIGFYTITTFLSKSLLLSPGLILLFWQISIFICLYISSRLICNRFIAIPFILASLFYILASQNAIRQGVSLSIYLVAVLYFMKHKSWTAYILISIVSLSMHRSAPIFISASTVFMLLYARMEEHYAARLRFLLIGAGVVFGLLLTFLLYRYSPVYSDANYDWGSERTSSGLKLIAILISFFISSALIRVQNLGYICRFLLEMRIGWLAILVPLSMAGEAFARVAYFYYLIEAILLIGLSSDRSYRNKLACCFLIASYGLAPNAINILTPD